LVSESSDSSITSASNKKEKMPPEPHSFPPYTYELPVEIYFEIYNSRFPRHPLFPYLLDAEVIDESEDSETKTYSMKRKIKLDIDAPSWFKRLSGLEFIEFIEKTSFDKLNRKITISSINDTFSSRALLSDVSTYEVHPENPDWCVFTQTGTAELKMSLFGFESKIEKWALELYKGRYDSARKLDQIMIQNYEEQKNKELLKQEFKEEHHDSKKSKKKKKKSKKSKKMVEEVTLMIPSNNDHAM